MHLSELLLSPHWYMIHSLGFICCGRLCSVCPSFLNFIWSTCPAFAAPNPALVWDPAGRLRPLTPSSCTLCCGSLSCSLASLLFPFFLPQFCLGLTPDTPPLGSAQMAGKTPLMSCTLSVLTWVPFSLCHGFCLALSCWPQCLCTVFMHCAFILHWMRTSTSLSVPKPSSVCGAGLAKIPGYSVNLFINKVCTIMRCQLVGMGWIILVDMFVYLTVCGNLGYFIK